MANFLYNTAKMRICAGSTGEIDLIANTIKVMALEDDTGETKDDEFIGDIITTHGAVEVTSTGYTGGFGGAGRKTLGTKAWAVNQSTDLAWFDCADVTWTAISRAAAESWVALVLIKEGSDDTDSPVIGHIDTAIGLPLIPNGSNITLTIDVAGIIQIT